MSPRYRVTLMPDERERLETLSTTGVRSAKMVLPAPCFCWMPEPTGPNGKWRTQRTRWA